MCTKTPETKPLSTVRLGLRPHWNPPGIGWRTITCELGQWEGRLVPTVGHDGRAQITVPNLA